MFNHHSKTLNNGHRDSRTLIAWYKLSDNGNDFSGNGYHLTTNGTIPYTTIDGFRCAGQFNGANYFSAGTGLMAAMTSASGSLTFEFSYYNPSGTDAWMMCSNSAGDEWGSLYQATGGNLWWRHNGPGVWSAPIATSGSWQTIGFVGYGTTLEMWRNGKIVSNASELITPGNWKFGAATVFNIGKHSTGALPFAGYLREIKVWNTSNTQPLPTNP